MKEIEVFLKPYHHERRVAIRGKARVARREGGAEGEILSDFLKFRDQKDEEPHACQSGFYNFLRLGRHWFLFIVMQRMFITPEYNPQSGANDYLEYNPMALFFSNNPMGFFVFLNHLSVIIPAAATAPAPM